MSGAQRTRAVLGVMSTGDQQLDEILGGGLPQGGTTIVAGSPGSGKTLLALEMVFAAAKSGDTVLYVTTLSEPSLRLLHHAEQFDFFDAALADRQVDFMDVGSLLLSAPEDAFSAVSERVREHGAALVVIDSFSAIHDVLPSRADARAFVYRLIVTLESMAATTLLLGSYSPEDTALLPEFAIADGVLHLDSKHDELASVRQLEVLKLRGRAFVSGVHSFDITSSGLSVFPRVRPPDPAETEAPAERVPTGVTGLDDLFSGGLPASSATVVQGSTGTGKTILALAFLLEGARRGEPGIYFGMDETPAQIRELGRTVGWDLASFERQGLLLLHFTSPVELSPDRYLHAVRAEVRRGRARRVVVDSLSAMETGVNSARRFKELIYSLGKHMRASAATLLMVMEVPEMLGTVQLSGHAVSSIADNVVILRYLEIGAQLGKTIAVLKARGVAHKTELRSYTVGAGGPHVGETFLGLRGVLTGLPTPAPET